MYTSFEEIKNDINGFENYLDECFVEQYTQTEEET